MYICLIFDSQWMWNSGTTTTTSFHSVACSKYCDADCIMTLFVHYYVYDLLKGHCDKGSKCFDLNGDCDNRPFCWGATLILMLIDFSLDMQYLALSLFLNSFISSSFLVIVLKLRIRKLIPVISSFLLWPSSSKFLFVDYPFLLLELLQYELFKLEMLSLILFFIHCLLHS